MTRRPSISTFTMPDGEVRQLRDPTALASGRQLRWLAARGLLELRDRPGEVLTVGECAFAIDRARAEEELPF